MVANRKNAPKAVDAAKRRLAKAATSTTRRSQSSSSKASPAKARASGTEEGEASLIEQIFDDILADTSHVVPVFALIQKRKREMSHGKRPAE